MMVIKMMRSDRKINFEKIENLNFKFSTENPYKIVKCIVSSNFFSWVCYLNREHLELNYDEKLYLFSHFLYNYLHSYFQSTVEENSFKKIEEILKFLRISLNLEKDYYYYKVEKSIIVEDLNYLKIKEGNNNDR